MPSNGAFTSVQVRRTLARPVTSQLPSLSHPASPPKPAPTAANGTKPKKIDWPMPVRQYVQRCFVIENNISGIGKEEMETKLKQVITEATESNKLHAIDWETLPLPQQMIQSERAKISSSNVTASWIEGSSTQETRDTTGLANPAPSRKRKSSEAINAHDEEDAQPPWRKPNNRNVFEDRITYPTVAHAERAEKRQKKIKDDFSGKGTSKFHNNLEKRKRRFEDGPSGVTSTNYVPAQDDSPIPDVDQGPVVGRSRDLEKGYFRLTSAPNPDFVRPLAVLEKTLELLKLKWRKENKYSYICDQFKSLRQDLTVQHIKNEFTVNVYEIHARIALEKGDLGEYNQCQTQLRALYSQNLGGHPAEFKAYRILYFIHTCNRTEMNDVLADLTPAEKDEMAVKHALDVRSALALGNYHKFFRLYLETPNMGAYLMDMFVVRERHAALANICRAYKPEVQIRFITEELAFESDGESVQFLVDNGARNLIEERNEGLQLLTGKAGAIFEIAKNDSFRRVDIKGQI
ncbi:MAG: hypothetical protein M1827_003961 [Pycnora praestabilis]|nr:MAG: hypothetical protein M1827_003961 [Pycnora praestabilis]